MKFNLNDRPGFFPMLMYGLQWWIVSIPCVVIIGIIVARLHYTDQVEQIFYMQKLFGIMGLAMIVQMLWGHRLPLVIGPASVLLIGILSTVSIGVEGIYSSLMIGGGILTLLAFSGLLSRLKSRIYSPDHCCDSVSDCFYSVPGDPPFDFCRKFVCLVPFVFCFVIGFGNDFGQ